VKALEGKEINLVCFTGDYQSPLAQAADTAFIIHDPQKFDDDIYWSNPFFGYCILGFERLLKMWFMHRRRREAACMTARQRAPINPVARIGVSRHPGISPGVYCQSANCLSSR
jgi:DNA-binding MurR/RpiR family transcriptional regulator